MNKMTELMDIMNFKRQYTMDLYGKDGCSVQNAM